MWDYLEWDLEVLGVDSEVIVLIGLNISQAGESSRMPEDSQDINRKLATV